MQLQTMHVNGSYPEEVLKQTTLQALHVRRTLHTGAEKVFTCLFGITQHYCSKTVLCQHEWKMACRELLEMEVTSVIATNTMQDDIQQGQNFAFE